MTISYIVVDDNVTERGCKLSWKEPKKQKIFTKKKIKNNLLPFDWIDNWKYWNLCAQQTDQPKELVMLLAIV